LVLSLFVDHGETIQTERGVRTLEHLQRGLIAGRQTGWRDKPHFVRATGLLGTAATGLGHMEGDELLLLLKLVHLVPN
jgi:hypothetical protein